MTFASYFLNSTANGAPVYPNVLTAPPNVAGSRPTIQYLSPDLERPAIHMADVTVERQIAQALTVSASYRSAAARICRCTWTRTCQPRPRKCRSSKAARCSRLCRCIEGAGPTRTSGPPSRCATRSSRHTTRWCSRLIEGSATAFCSTPATRSRRRPIRAELDDLHFEICDDRRPGQPRQ